MEKMAKKSNNSQVAKINQNFIIRWKSQDESKSHLVSAGQYHKIVGHEFKMRHFNKVMDGGMDRYTFLIRNRLKIDFISK